MAKWSISVCGWNLGSHFSPYCIKTALLSAPSFPWNLPNLWFPRLSTTGERAKHNCGRFLARLPLLGFGSLGHDGIRNCTFSIRAFLQLSLSPCTKAAFTGYAIDVIDVIWFVERSAANKVKVVMIWPLSASLKDNFKRCRTQRVALSPSQLVPPSPQKHCFIEQGFWHTMLRASFNICLFGID